MYKKRGKRLIITMLLLSFIVSTVGSNTGIVPIAKAADPTTEAFLSKYSDITLDKAGGKNFQTVFSDYITVEGTKLMDGVRELKFVSLNYPQATSDTPWEQANAIKTIKAMGGNVTRSYTIPVYNGNNASTAYVTGVNSDGKLTFNEDALNQLDSLLDICNRYGIRLIIPLVDHWHWIGGMDGYCKLAGIPINTTSSLDPNAWQFYTNATARNYFKQMISHLMERTNSVSGIKYKDDPAVICWETGNELAAYDDPAKPKFPQSFTTDIAAHLKSTGIRQLVLDGKMDATSESLKDPNVDILGSHYYTGYYPEKLRNDTKLSFNNGNNPVLDGTGNPLPGKPFILGEFGAYTKYQDVEKVFDAGIEAGTNGMMMWSLRAHKDGYGYYFHPEDPGNWAAYHWPGFPSGDYYDERNIVRSIYAYANLVNGAAGTIEDAKRIPILAPETEEAPLLYPITTVGDIQWRGVVGGAWYEIQRAEGANPSEQDFITIADEADYVYDSGRNWENKDIACIAGYHDQTAVTGKTYSYRLRACNESGVGLWSNVQMTGDAKHIVVDNLDMIQVSSTDRNPTEIRNTYSYDHSANVTVSGGVLQNTSSTEGYIAYRARIPMESVEIITKNKPENAPRVMVSSDDVTYTEVGVTGSNMTYTANSLPKNIYFVRVYIAPNNGCMLDSVKTVYCYTGTPGELIEYQEQQKDVLIQDESFHAANPFYAFKSSNLDFMSNGEISGLATIDPNEASLIYKTSADMTSFRVIVYTKNNAVPKISSSMDGVSYQDVEALHDIEIVSGYQKYIYANVDLTEATRYLKISYPAALGDVVVKSVEVASGAKRLPMQDKAPVNVIEDGEYYFGSDMKLNNAYSLSGAYLSKAYDNVDFSKYDVLYAWIKGDNSANSLVFSFTDKNDVVWTAKQELSFSNGKMVKFDFKSLTPSTPNAVQDFHSVKYFTIGVEGADTITANLDDTNLYTGNYGLRLTYQKDILESKLYLDNIYVGSLTKVDDYEGYNGANSLLQAAYSRNTGGGMLNLTLDPIIKSEGSYALKFEYNYQGKGYAGATKSMDYLNLKDYDGFNIWYMGDGSGNSLTFQVKTSDGLSWEAIGYMDGIGATELYMPFESFVAPSWDQREGTLNKNLNIVDFSIYTNKVDSGSETGTLYFDDIKGANFKDDLASASVHITTEPNQVIREFPYVIEGQANYVKYITLKIGTKTINVPVNEDGTWNYVIQKESGIYNGENLEVSASILYHNYNLKPIQTDHIAISVQVDGNDEPVDVTYENYAKNGDFSRGFTDWTIEGFTVSDGVANKLENGAFVCWSNEAYRGTLSQTLTVPNGIYTLKAKMKVKSGLNDARMSLSSGHEVVQSPFLDTQDTEKSISLDKTIEVRNNQITISFIADAPAGGLVFAVDDVELNKVGELNLVFNGDFELVEAEWPNLPIGWNTSYSGGDGWSPIKGENGAFVGYAGQAYTFTLSQDIAGLETGLYKLSANIKLNDGIVNDIMITVKAGEKTLIEKSVLSQLQANVAKTISLSGIPVDTDKLTVMISGDIGSKGLSIDDVTFVRTGDLPFKNYIMNPSFEENGGAVAGKDIIGWEATDSWGTGELSKTEDGGYDGSYALSRWWSEPYTATNTQTLSNLPSGIYTLKAWAMSKASEPGKPYEITTIGIKVGNKEIKTVQIAAEQSWKQYVIGNIEIKSSDIVTVTIDTKDTVGGGWSKIDLVELNKVADITEPSPTPSPSPTPTPTPSPTPSPTPTPTPSITPTPISEVKVSPKKATLYVGGNKDKSTMIEVLLPDSISGKAEKPKVSISYQSSDSKVSSVSKSGKVNAKKAGKAIIQTTVTIDGATKVFNTSITVKKAYIEIVKQTSNMKKGDTFTFKAKGYGVDVNNITWKTTEKSIIVINKKSGKATAKSKGTDYVVAKAGGITSKIKVVVSN